MPSTSSLVTSSVFAVPFHHGDAVGEVEDVVDVRKMPMPSALSCLISSPTCAVSCGPSAAVGSSMIRMRALKWIARAIATDCLWPPEARLTTRRSSEHRADDHVLHRAVEIQQRHARLQRLHDQRAEHGPVNTPPASEVPPITVAAIT